MPPAADVAFAFLQRFCPGRPDREELRFALAALVHAERQAAAEAMRERCVRVADTYPARLPGGLLAALRNLPLE
jgi:hypothetical protein